MFWAPANDDGCCFGYHCCRQTSPNSIKHRGWYKYIYFYTNLTNQTKSFDSGLGKYMCNAARPLGGVDSLNPHRWRGKWLHHHGGGVCWLFVLLWINLLCHKLIVCKKWYKNNLKMRLTALLFGPPRHAPHFEWLLPFFIDWDEDRKRLSSSELVFDLTDVKDLDELSLNSDDKVLLNNKDEVLLDYNWRALVSCTVNCFIVVTKVVVANRNISYLDVK